MTTSAQTYLSLKAKHPKFLSQGKDFANFVQNTTDKYIKKHEYEELNGDEMNNLALMFFELGKVKESIQTLTKLQDQFSDCSTVYRAKLHQTVTSNLRDLKRVPVAESDLAMHKKRAS